MHRNTLIEHSCNRIIPQVHMMLDSCNVTSELSNLPLSNIVNSMKIKEFGENIDFPKLVSLVTVILGQ